MAGRSREGTMRLKFNPANYSVPLDTQFIQSKSEPKILLGRTEQLRELDRSMSRYDDKTQVISIVAPSGMGKTAMCTYLATKHENDPLTAARSAGRLILYDMKQYSGEDPTMLWRDLIIHHICYIFHGCTVAGIRFTKLSMNSIIDGKITGANSTLVSLINNKMRDVDMSIEQLIRLTNSAFGVSSNAMPVFILDEVQSFIGAMPVVTHGYNPNSSFTKIVHRTQLSRSFAFLPHSCYAIVAGTVDGNLNDIHDGTQCSVSDIFLSPLSFEEQFMYGQAEKNENDSWPSSFDEFLGNEELMHLMSLTYGIPSLCKIAMNLYWKNNNAYVDLVRLYTKELETNFNDTLLNIQLMDISLLSHIMMACGCGLKARLSDVVPYTTTTWESLIKSAVVFPSGRTGMWGMKQSFISPYFAIGETKLQKVKEFVSKNVDGADITKCYFDYSKWINESSRGIHDIGNLWEDVVVNSLAIRFYLVSKNEDSVYLSTLYNFDKDAFIELSVCLKTGIKSNKEEMELHAIVDSPALYDQNLIQSPQYDFFLSQSHDDKYKLLPAQCKNALTMSSAETIEKQLEECEQLLWIYPGYKKDDENTLFAPKLDLVTQAVEDRRLIFLSGYGCCCASTVDMIILLKDSLKRKLDL